MGIALRLHKLLPKLDQRVYVLPERFGVGIPEVGGDITEQLGREVWKGVGPLGRDGKKVGL
jgi:hypothetical protein